MLANSEDPAQMSVASDLGLHCLFAYVPKKGLQTNMSKCHRLRICLLLQVLAFKT